MDCGEEGEAGVGMMGARAFCRDNSVLPVCTVFAEGVRQSWEQRWFGTQYLGKQWCVVGVCARAHARVCVCVCVCVL